MAPSPTSNETADLESHGHVESTVNAAAKAVHSLHEAGIPVGPGVGTLCGFAPAYPLGVIAYEPSSLRLEPWAFLATARARGSTSVFLPVCARRAAEAAELTGHPLWAPRSGRTGVELRADPVASFLGDLASDRGLSTFELLRAASPMDAEALELLRSGTGVYVPSIAVDDLGARALRRLRTLACVDDLATVLALSTPGRDREPMLDELFARGVPRWSWPATALFEPLFAESAGLPIWHEQMNALLVSLLGVSKLEAPLLRARWHRAPPDTDDVAHALIARLNELGFAGAVSSHVVHELDRRNRATFCRAHVVPQCMISIVCARALLDDPAGYRARLRQHRSGLRAAHAGDP